MNLSNRTCKKKKAMPGRNCCLPQCTVSDTNKHKDIGLFQISTRKDKYHTIWRKKLIDFLAIYRPLDGLLRERITKGNVYFCEKHFSPEDIEFTSEYIIFMASQILYYYA